MPQSIPSLWPSGIVEETMLRTPTAILKEQAAFLAQMTQNLVQGKVKTAQGIDSFEDQLYLVVPALQNYSTVLLVVDHPLDQYPARVRSKALPARDKADELLSTGSKVAQNEDSFLEIVKEVLNSDYTKKLLRALLAQARS